MNTKTYQAEYRKRKTTAKAAATQAYRQAVELLFTAYASPKHIPPAELEELGHRVAQLLFFNREIDAVGLQYQLSMALEYIAGRRELQAIDQQRVVSSDPGPEART